MDLSSRSTRRGFVLLAGGMAGLGVSAALAQTTGIATPTGTGTTLTGCSLGFLNGLLKFGSDCMLGHPSMSIGGVTFQVAPPTHLVLEEFDQAAADAALAEAEAARDDQLADRRAKKRKKQERRNNRKQKQRDHRRAVKRNRKARRAAAQSAEAEDFEPLDG